MTIHHLVNYIVSTEKIVWSDFLLNYNISDHYFGGRTDILLKSFKVLVKHCQDVNKLIDGYSELSLKEINRPEIKISIAILKTLNVDISFNNMLVTHIINKYFDVYNSYNFNNFIYKCNGSNVKLENKIHIYKHNYVLSVLSYPNKVIYID